MTPAQLVLKVYDVAIVAGKNNDTQKASKAIVELISALRFEHGEISLGLFRLYQYCLDSVKVGKFDDAVKILSELRNTWLTVMKSNQPLRKEEREVI
jgi:flagellin-specific chaperone FliS